MKTMKQTQNKPKAVVPSHTLQVNATQLNGKGDAILVQHTAPNTSISFLQQHKFKSTLEQFQTINLIQTKNHSGTELTDGILNTNTRLNVLFNLVCV